jgi:uncharacterized Zn finger protein
MRIVNNSVLLSIPFYGTEHAIDMAQARQLKDVLTRDTLCELAGARSFERGEDYFESGQVITLVEHRGKLTAVVQGTEDYRVELSVRGGELNYDCTCPVGGDGAFCKHCVATGLAWLANSSGNAPSGKTRALDTPVVTLDDARKWLAKQEKSKLAEMLLDQAATGTQLREQLLLQAAKSAGKGANITAVRQALDRATRTGGFVDYRAAYDFSSGIDRVVSSIADLLKVGHAEEAIELIEHALGKVEQATMSMDDSDGYMSGILHRLQELHFEACRTAKPEPESLAKRLFDWEMRTAFDTFYDAANTYAELLGEPGLAVYRSCAAAAWDRVPKLSPGEKDPEEYGRTYRIKNIMETLARQAGDIEALVAIKARNLSSAYAYLEIAKIYREANRRAKALNWAERGLKQFPANTDSRLCEFLADEYHHLDRHDEAMNLIFKIFSEHTSLENYQTLKKHGNPLDQWPAWRDRALSFVREQVQGEKTFAQKKQTWGWNPAPRDHSLLVQIFLWEKDVDAAWREARDGGCHESWWLELARLREKQFPAEAVPIYQKHVETLINQKNGHSYAEAAKLLRKIRGLMAQQQLDEQFAGYLSGVLSAHKPKRNFMKLAARL